MDHQILRGEHAPNVGNHCSIEYGNCGYRDHTSAVGLLAPPVYKSEKQSSENVDTKIDRSPIERLLASENVFRSGVKAAMFTNGQIWTGAFRGA